jgi:hypothetical protein
MYDGLAVRRGKAFFVRKRRTASPSYEFHHSLGVKDDNGQTRRAAINLTINNRDPLGSVFDRGRRAEYPL